jgi:predicted dehydrogenase
MRLALIGVSHWHQTLYLAPMAALPDAAVVGVSDPDPAAAQAWAERLGCEGSPDFRDLCDRLRPDFVFALGRHCDMADEARYLIEAGIPFALEKPCGMDSSELRDLVARAETKGAFAAVPLVFRNGELLQALRELDPGDGFQHMAFRFIAGFPARYLQADCAWMLDPATSGGGPTINLAPHFFDLCRLLMGEDAKVAAAMMSNAAWGYGIEDYSAVVLSTRRGLCTVETGYLFPAPTSTFDLHYAIRSKSNYCVVHDPQALEVFDNDGRSSVRRVSCTNVPHYRDFVHDVLARVRADQPPLASLAEMLPVMELVEQAYALCHDLSGQCFNQAPAGARRGQQPRSGY